MEQKGPAPLVGWDIHGFRTTADLNIEKLKEDASKRWLRPNEVHAILSNYTRFKIQPRPVMNPENGSLLLFDRKMLRNFRKDGHNWRKKKDGRTVQEAHEKLKIGAEEKIHVYYARSEDDPNFYRRCYWLLDKDLERIVLVHYRQISEDGTNQLPFTTNECQEDLPLTNALHHVSPLTPLNSTSGSSHSEMSGSVLLSEEINSGSGISPDEKKTKLGNHKLILDEINTLDWEALVEQPFIDSSAPREGMTSFFNQQVDYKSKDARNNGNLEGTSFEHPSIDGTGSGFVGVNQPFNGHLQPVEVDQDTVSPMARTINASVKGTDFQMGSETPGILASASLQSQNSLGQWDYIIDDPPGSLDGFGCQISNGHMSNIESAMEQFSVQKQVFSITDVSPAWSYSNEETKVIVVGNFHDSHKHLSGSNVFCVFGDRYVASEMVQPGVYRSMALPHTPGSVEFYLTLDGHTPISQVVNFEFRAATNTRLKSGVSSPEVDNTESEPRDFGVLTRLAHLLFSTTNSMSILSSKISPNTMKEAKRFASITTSSLEKDWVHLLGLIGNKEISFSSLNENFLVLVLKNKLQEWLLEKVAEGCKSTALDSQGLGVIHLCAILDYSWAARLFSVSGLSLDFRDACGWTALHWAACCGRVNMVAALLSAGANPSLVTDPSSEFPGGCTAADLASQAGYEGLGAYLAEKGLRAHFEAMTLSGNVAAPLSRSRSSTDPVDSENMDPQNLSEQEMCLKDSLAAYRNAADAADHIQAAYRERSLKLQLKAVQSSNPEAEVDNLIAALKIQKAFRNYNRRKMMKAAARIQGTFRTWQARRNFLNMRRQAVKIQAIFRGHQVRKQYRKIIWSVGVLEKAVLRWRLKRKGLRGLQVESTAVVMDVQKEENCGEEDFYQISREQAEERVKRSVVRVQAMFRSYRAQQEYRKMKLAYHQAELEFNEFADSSKC